MLTRSTDNALSKAELHEQSQKYKQLGEVTVKVWRMVGGPNGRMREGRSHIRIAKLEVHQKVVARSAASLVAT